MRQFLEEYGKAIFVLVLMAILIAFASPIGIRLKDAITNQMAKLEANINEKEKEYEAVDIEKSWTESHTGSYFFERVSSDKTNVDYNKWKSNNKDKHSTSAVSTFTIDVPKEMEYSFDWTVSSENNFDKLKITLNDTTVVNNLSGTKNETQKVTLKSGINTLTTTYSKDSSGSIGDDCATITLPKVSINVCKNKQTGEISDHIYDNGKITKEPTCTENGEKTFTCTKCGHTKTEVVNKLGHNFVNDVCTRCGLSVSSLPAVDQVWCYLDKNYELVISQDKIDAPADAVITEMQLDIPSNIIYHGEGSYTSYAHNIKTVRLEGIIKPKNCKWWLQNLTGLTQIKNIENLITSECSNMSMMFDGCYSLTNVDVSGFDTSKVTDMSKMFSHCNSLISIDLRKWDTTNVTTMANMFYTCGLISANLNGLDLRNCDNLSSIFSDCGRLENVDLQINLTKNKCTALSSMFYRCNKLTDKSVKISQIFYDEINRLANDKSKSFQDFVGGQPESIFNVVK